MAFVEEFSKIENRDELLKINPFLKHSIDLSPFINGSILLAQPGIPHSTLDSVSLNPQRVPDLSALNSSEGALKRLFDDLNTRLLFEAGSQVLRGWFPQNPLYTFRTTGGLSGKSLAKGASGMRRTISYDDMIRLNEKFDILGLPSNGRFLVAHRSMLPDKWASYKNSHWESDVDLHGCYATVLGFNIFIRPAKLVCDNSKSPILKDMEAPDDASDNLAAIAWHSSCAGYAVDRVQWFENLGSPEYLGDVIAARVQAKGVLLTPSMKGTVAIIQSGS